MLLRDQDAGEAARELDFLSARGVYEAISSYWSKPRPAPEDERGVYWHRMNDGRCGLIGCVFPWSLCTADFESLTLFEIFTSGLISEEVYNLFKQIDKISYTYEVDEWPQQLAALGEELGYLRKEPYHGEEET